jgi:ribonuclease P protein component
MIPRRFRLSRAGFAHLAASPAARRAAGAHFSVLTAREPGGIGVVVSKKVARRSVDRHRIKRHVREALKELGVPGLNASIVVFARSSSATLSYAAVRDELAHLLRAHLPSGTL